MAVDPTPSGGMTGTHPPADPDELLIGPSTTNEFNAITLRPIPIACWKIEDVRFAFDSSFVTPDAATEFHALRDLRIKHSAKGAPSASTGLHITT
jgi:hypothetical protein